MSFEIKEGDLFASVEEGFIVHGCNAQGVMGSGFAKLVRAYYPEAYETYIAQKPYYILGEVIPAVVAPNLVIVNAITQEFYGTDKVHADYDAIAQAMKGTIHLVGTNMIQCRDVHMPLIGGGLAGGDKERIIQIMRDVFETNEVKATLWLLS